MPIVKPSALSNKYITFTTTWDTIGRYNNNNIKIGLHKMRRICCLSTIAFLMRTLFRGIKVKAVPLHAMKTLEGRGGIALTHY
jgi:hypothetical protein